MSLGPIYGKLGVAFFSATILLASVGVLSYRRVAEEAADQEWVEHTHLVLERLESVRGLLRDLDAQDHAYRTMPGRSFLKAADDDVHQLQEQATDLRGLTKDNANQQAILDRLEPLVAAQKTALDMKLGERASQAAPGSSFAQGMPELLTLTDGMIIEERRLLTSRKQSAQATASRTRTVIVFGSLLAMLLFSAAAVAVLREMRRRSHAEEALQAAKERYQVLFDANPLPVWVYDIDTLKFLDVNPAAVETYGYSREEFLALTIKEIRPEEDVPIVLRAVANLGAHKDDSEVWKLRRHRKKDGTLIDVEGISHPVLYAGRSARLVVALDVTQRKRAEEALRLSEERFRLTVSNVRDYAILMLDPEGRVVSWNDGAERIKGYKAEEIVGRHFSCFYPPEEIERGTPARILEEATQRGRCENEGWRVRKDGSRFWANVVVTALHDEAEQLRGFAKVTRDVSERKKYEEEMLRRSAELDAANKELEAFAYSVSHDLRAPLRGIDGFSQALLEDYAPQLDATGKDYLNRVRAATQRMAMLIDDLLNLSRVTRAEMHRERIDLSGMALAIAGDLRSGDPNRDTDFVVAPNMNAVGDTRLVRVVLENLLGNSWKFTSKQAHAKIEFAKSRSNGSENGAFFVRDNGAGFNQAHASRLFGAFQRLHGMNEFPGTGIGLATVQRIIHRHGGNVWAEGEVDKGATFYFTL